MNFEIIKNHPQYNEICENKIIFINFGKYKDKDDDDEKFFKDPESMMKLINDIEYDKNGKGCFSIFEFVALLMDMRLNFKIFDVKTLFKSTIYQISFYAYKVIERLHDDDLCFISKKFKGKYDAEKDQKNKNKIKQDSINKIWGSYWEIMCAFICTNDNNRPFSLDKDVKFISDIDDRKIDITGISGIEPNIFKGIQCKARNNYFNNDLKLGGKDFAGMESHARWLAQHYYNDEDAKYKVIIMTNISVLDLLKTTADHLGEWKVNEDTLQFEDKFKKNVFEIYGSEYFDNEVNFPMIHKNKFWENIHDK